MPKIFRAIYLISLSLMVGGIVFFSFFVAPVVFQNFSNEEAGKIVSAIFPGYHQFKIVCGLLALGCLLILGFLNRKWSVIRLLLISVVVVVNLYAGMVAGPEASKVREEIRKQKEKGALSVELKEQFDLLHQRAVLLNGSVLLVGLVLLLDAGIRIKI